MTRHIRPLTADDLSELKQFLLTGFQAAPEADFATIEVLRWKYLERQGPASCVAITGGDQSPPSSRREEDVSDDPAADQPLSYIAQNETGRIVGHLGLCRTYFEGQGIGSSSGRVATMHIIDWLGSPERRSIGISLMRLSHQGAQTQFGLGVSPSALAVGERAGYELRGLVPVYNRVLRAGYWLRSGSAGLVARWMRLGRDLASRLIRLPARPRAKLVLERVAAFGPEISDILTKAKSHVILTDRNPARLNAFLRFPRQAFSGWHLRDQTGSLRGFALLNLVPHDEGRTRTGKIVDCLLDDIDDSTWHAALLALTRRTCATRSRHCAVLRIHALDEECAFEVRLRLTIWSEIPYPRSRRTNSARCNLSSHNTGRGLRIHVIFHGISNKREYLARALGQLGVIGLLERAMGARRPALIVLTYHRIGETGSDQFYDPVISASPHAFRVQMKWLHDRIHILTLEELDARVQNGGPWKEPTAFVTFDDGYRDNFDTAVPILREFKVPATFFIPTEFFESAKLPWWDYVAFVIKKTEKRQLNLKRRQRGDDQPISIDLNACVSTRGSHDHRTRISG